MGDGLEQLGQDSAPYKAVESRIPHELKEYRNSRQVSGQLPFHAVSWTILIGSLLSFSSALFARKLPEKANFWNNLICVVILLVFYNAFIASTFSTVIGRLQSRIFWVLPLISIVYFILSIKGHKPSDGLNVET